MSREQNQRLSHESPRTGLFPSCRQRLPHHPFLIDDSILTDARTGMGDLRLDEMRKIDYVCPTHSHLDHIAALPLMLDAVGSLRSAPVQIDCPSGPRGGAASPRL